MSRTERRNAGGGRTVNRTSKWISPEKRAAIYLRDQFRCVLCGKKPSGFHQHKTAIAPGLQVDHVLPRSRGGDNRPENLITACERCNVSKRDRTVAEWIAETPRGKRLDAGGHGGVFRRIAAATTTPIDLVEGKKLVGPKATRPLPEFRSERRPSSSSLAEAPF